MRAAARALSMPQFVRRHDGLYFLKRPIVDTIRAPDKARTAPSFDTQRIGVETIQLMRASLEELAELLGAWAHKWMIAALEKRTDTFPDRISIGRASQSDVVLKLPFISKLHAHLFVGDDGLVEIVDRSSNGIRLDGEPIGRDQRTPISLGQTVSFGPLEVELHDGTSLYHALREGED